MSTDESLTDRIGYVRALHGDWPELRRAASAVVAAGRPHGQKQYTILGEPPHACSCVQCTAWDELSKLLEAKP